MSYQPEIRRTTPRVGPLPDDDAVLVARIRAEIEATGPMTFARFMELALTDPERGYYATSDDRPTRSGDYLTGPELHPLFGATIARAVEEQWRLLGRPDPHVLIEFGAGRGTLIVDVMRALARAGSDLVEAVDYTPVELNGPREALIRERVTEAGFGRAIGAGGRREDGPGSANRTGTIIANEYLDALPVHRVVGPTDRLGELLVDWSAGRGGGGFIETPAAPSTPRLRARLDDEGVVLAAGQRAEVNLSIDGWAVDALGRLDRGFAIVIDYGAEAPALYDPRRVGGTLRAYSGHRAHADPFSAIGHQDITAHVDFTAVGRVAARLGWPAVGLTTQAEFLVGSGLGDLVAEGMTAPGLDLEAGLAIRAAVGRLLDPSALGGFRVLVLGRGRPEGATLAGLEYRVQR